MKFKRGLVIDARFLNDSGIGVYLKSVLPAIIQNIKDYPIKIYTYSDKNSFFKNIKDDQHLNIKYIKTPVYSIKEQFFWLQEQRSFKGWLFWAPQYNIPLFHEGPLLITIYDLAHLILPEYKNNFLKYSYAKLMFNRAVHRASKIITISHFTKDQLVKELKIDADRIKVIHLAIQNQRFEKRDFQSDGFSLNNEITLKDHFQILKSDYALYVGNIKPHKNLRNLFYAFQMIQKEFPQFKLIVVGQKDGFITPGEDIQTLGEELNLNFEFSGKIDDVILGLFYKSAKMLIIPSKYEGFGLPALEAMEFKCPIVSSHAASLPEVCGEAAVYFDPNSPQDMADKILNVYRDHNLRENLILNGQNQIRKFNLKNLCNETIKVIRDFLPKDS